MKGDFTRNTFNPAKHFTRVMMQQGRVQLDADWNEQASILLHYLRTVVADLVGASAAPVHGGGFDLVAGASSEGDLALTPGRMYVDGILIENELPLDPGTPRTSYLNQPDLPNPDPLTKGATYGVYLDVWERYIAALEDPDIREKALGGPDTAGRARVVWQLRTRELGDAAPLSSTERAALQTQLTNHRARLKELSTQPMPTDPAKRDSFKKRIQGEQDSIARLEVMLASAPAGDWCQQVEQFPRLSKARMRARVEPTEPSTDPCIQAPDARYRGATNLLYRVEIQRGGAGQPAGTDTPAANVATLKWSRNNGSQATRLFEVQGKQLVVQSTRGFSADIWVELSNDALELQGQPGPLLQLVNVEGEALTFDPDTNTGGVDLTRMTYVRRWDQQAVGDLELVEGAVALTEGEWISLEDGIQVWFEPGGTYRSGDYWLVPARVISGGIEWPVETGASGEDEPRAEPPQGITHHYAPLGVVAFDGANIVVQERCRCEFLPINECARYGYDDMGIGVDLLDI